MYPQQTWAFSGNGMYLVAAEVDGELVVVTKEVEPGPEIPPEVWNDRPISKEACMAAVRAMCS